jgi:hypothetical protein
LRLGAVHAYGDDDLPTVLLSAPDVVAVIQVVDLLDGLESGQPLIAEYAADDLKAAAL